MALSGLLELLKNHFELAFLEGKFEIEEGRRRLLKWSFGAVLLFFSFVYLQLFMIRMLMRAGLELEWIGLLGMVFFLLAGWILCRASATRAVALGRPFEGSTEEFKKSLLWIEKTF